MVNVVVTLGDFPGCRKTIEEENGGSGTNTWFRAFYLVMGICGGLQLFFALILRVPWFRMQADKCSNFYVVQFVKWVHQVLLSSTRLLLLIMQEFLFI